jgi:hypothetical protein
MNRADDERLWELLGRAKAVQPSPFFARNVFRQIREESQRGPSWRAWLGWRRLVPAVGAATALICAGILLHQPAVPEKSTTDNDPIAKIDPQDYEVVADLDDLLASEDNNLWDDSSSL